MESARNRSGYRLAVISNVWPPYLRSTRAHFEQFFGEWVEPELQLFSYREGHPKPSSVMFRRMLEIAEVKPECAVMIGDSYAEDVAPAASLGIRTVWLMHRPHREVEPLVGVINGEKRAPTRALASIAQLNAAMIDAITRSQ